LKTRLPHPPVPAATQAATTLSKAHCGVRLRIISVRPDSPAALRLKELGFYESAEVRKVRDGSALICQLHGIRLAIGRDLGADIMVERMTP